VRPSGRTLTKLIQMKTAMQEHFEWLQENQLYFGIPIEAIDNAEDLLEKEKEQIIEAHKIGWEDCQEYIKTIGQTTRKGKKYYNQTYKPERI